MRCICALSVRGFTSCSQVLELRAVPSSISARYSKLYPHRNANVSYSRVLLQHTLRSGADFGSCPAPTPP